MIDADGRAGRPGVRRRDHLPHARAHGRLPRRRGRPRTAATTADGAMRTGDLGRARRGRRLLRSPGRLKDLIISGGMNVAPAEIEAVACRHPAVASAVVVGVPDARWGETPVVVAVAAARRTTSRRTTCSTFCRGELAGFKRPSAAALVDDLPLTGIGKSAKGARPPADPRAGRSLLSARLTAAQRISRRCSRPRQTSRTWLPLARAITLVENTPPWLIDVPAGAPPRPRRRHHRSARRRQEHAHRRA